MLKISIDFNHDAEFFQHLLRYLAASPNPKPKNMKSTILCLAIALLCASCSKIDNLVENAVSKNTPTSGFTEYTIKQGSNYCDQSAYKAVDLTELNFVVKFDSTAIYKTASAENQYDINKLYGFSDNGADHHQFSARFGWRWSDKALRLFAYVYNNAVWIEKELGTVAIGSEVSCSIKVTGSNYIFTMNDRIETMPRLSTTATAKGYQLYPYFGGDEPAPHDVHIWIKQN
jgi:hypothetical protein